MRAWLKGTLSQKRVWKFVVVKFQCFSRPLLEGNYMHGSISIENISFPRNWDIKITNANSVTDASVWAMFISANSDTLKIAKHSLFSSPINICRCGFHFRSTDLWLFCDRALLMAFTNRSLSPHVEHKYMTIQCFAYGPGLWSKCENSFIWQL